jgi:hypothetical protein
MSLHLFAGLRVRDFAAGAGNGVVTIFVDDLDAHVAEIATRGLEPDERETYSNGVRKSRLPRP